MIEVYFTMLQLSLFLRQNAKAFGNPVESIRSSLNSISHNSQWATTPTFLFQSPKQFCLLMCLTCCLSTLIYFCIYPPVNILLVFCLFGYLDLKCVSFFYVTVEFPDIFQFCLMLCINQTAALLACLDVLIVSNHQNQIF